MAKRRAQPQRSEELPDPTGRRCGRFPQQWAEIDQAELQRRHDQAALLVARGHGAVTWESLLGRK